MSELLIVEGVRAGDSHAWRELIQRYEGRLLRFVEARLRDRAASEDVVQETFIGLLVSLPNYDERQSLESYLFAIAAYKVIDYRRRLGRRPALAAGSIEGSSGGGAPPARQPRASALARSGERRQLEEQALASAVQAILADWRQRGQWLHVACAELLFVHGAGNRETAALLQISEQTVANRKFEFVERLRHAIERQHLSPDVFPELDERGERRRP
ncbi:MAG TPA: RNA polymerase sigma factor [Pirellulales bacterium]|jgi:RNA polymerase sigma-70 factor (ECF subfamily)|nr:RNA polymerase sigma factor [Pirellulales bacterium]